MSVGMGSMFAIRLGLAYVLCVILGWGAIGVWSAMVLSWAVIAILVVWRYRSGKWKEKCGLA